jgi:hypothetical protein
MAPNHQHHHHHHNHYGTQDYAGDQAAQTHRTMQRMPAEDRTARTDLQDTITGSQAAQLSPEVRMGDDRALADTPNWDAFDSAQLYAFATQNNSPSTADDLGRSFNAGGNSLADAANGLLDAVTRLDGAWSGAAADSASGALTPLAQAAGQAGQTAQMMGVQMSRQALAATEVRKLPPARTFDQKSSLTAMLAGGPAAMQADLKAQKDAAEAVKREQISYLTTYTKAMSAVDAQTPSFVPPPARRIDPGAGGDAKIGASPVPYSGRLGGGEQGTSTGAPSGGFTGAAPGAGFDSQDGSDGGGDFVMPGSLPGTSTAGFTPGGTAPVSAPSVSAGAAPHTAAPAAGAGGFGGAFGNFGAGAGGTAAGAGAAASGAGAGESARGGTGSRGAGAMGVPGPVAAGRGGAGMGGAGGRRRDEEDDEQHERPSFLVEGDPDATFGSDQLSAPSVIGRGDDEQ